MPTNLRLHPRLLRLLLAALLSVAGLRAMAISDQPDTTALRQMGEQAFYAGDYAKALKAFHSLHKTAQDAHNDHLLCETAYSIGACYFSISAYGDARKYFTDAYELFPRSQWDGHMRRSILGALAGVYFEEQNYAKARELALQILREAQEAADTVLIQQNAQGLALIANKQGDFALSHQMLKLARQYTPSDKAEAQHLQAIEAESYILQKDYRQAERTCRLILAEPQAYSTDRNIALIYLIRSLTKRGALTEAQQLVGEAQATVSLRNRPLLCETLSQLARLTGDTDRAFAYMDSMVIYQDSLKEISNQQLAEHARIKLEVMEYTAKSEKEMAKLRQNQIVAWLLTCISALLVVMAVWYYRVQRQKNRREKQLLALRLEREQQAKLLAEQQMKETELLARYQEEIMKRELAEKQSKLNATTLFATARNALIEQVIEALTGPDMAKDHNPKVANIVQDLKLMLHGNADNEQLCIDFEAANPDFVERLKRRYETLSSSDIRFLSFVRMNLSNKEIAELMNITPESCKRRRQRIAKKMELDSSAQLFDFILNF